jgi:hypothetical protein
MFGKGLIDLGVPGPDHESPAHFRSHIRAEPGAVFGRREDLVNGAAGEAADDASGKGGEVGFY